MKHLHRLMMTSATYRLSSSVADSADNLGRDPDNLFGWRRTPLRLESQVVRDSILALSGRLDTRDRRSLGAAEGTSRFDAAQPVLFPFEQRPRSIFNGL